MCGNVFYRKHVSIKIAVGGSGVATRTQRWGRREKCAWMGERGKGRLLIMVSNIPRNAWQILFDDLPRKVDHKIMHFYAKRYTLHKISKMFCLWLWGLQSRVNNIKRFMRELCVADPHIPNIHSTTFTTHIFEICKKQKQKDKQTVDDGLRTARI